MKQRFLMWGLASIAFVVTLAFSSWHEGLWPYDEAPGRSTHAASLASADPVPLPAQPFAPEHSAPPAATPIVVAATPPQPQATQQPETPPPEEAPPPMPTAEQEVDTAEFLEHRDRAAQHSARSR
jgi:hypothetical protein